MKFRLFGKSFGCDFSRFSNLLDFSKSCLPESIAMRIFNMVEFSDAVFGKSARLRFSDIHNPSLKFLHRWMPFTLFSMAELRSVTTHELKCLFAMVNRIKYTPVADIVDYFKNMHKMSGPIVCTSMVTQIAMNLECSEMANDEGIPTSLPSFVDDIAGRVDVQHKPDDLHTRPITRARAKLLEQQVNSLLIEYNLFTNENFILPKSLHVCMIRFVAEASMTHGGEELHEDNCKMVPIISESTREERKAGAPPLKKKS
jgi:hypothetical protein